MSRRRAAGADAMGYHDDLTPRELDVLHLLVRGYSNREIAPQLQIAETTVRGHIESMKQKLGAKSRTHLAAIAICEGLVDLPRDEYRPPRRRPEA